MQNMIQRRRINSLAMKCNKPAVVQNRIIAVLTLHIGRWGSLKLTSKLSLLRSKCTMFLLCRYSIPKAVSMAIISRLRRSRLLHMQRILIASASCWIISFKFLRCGSWYMRITSKTYARMQTFFCFEKRPEAQLYSKLCRHINSGRTWNSSAKPS